jgi:hypothetical protein
VASRARAAITGRPKTTTSRARTTTTNRVKMAASQVPVAVGRVKAAIERPLAAVRTAAQARCAVEAGGRAICSVAGAHILICENSLSTRDFGTFRTATKRHFGEPQSARVRPQRLQPTWARGDLVGLKGDDAANESDSRATDHRRGVHEGTIVWTLQ